MLQASIINENCRTSSIHATSSTHSQHCNCSGGSVGVSESIMSESMSEPVETSHAEVLTPVETVHIEVTTSVSELVFGNRGGGSVGVSESIMSKSVSEPVETSHAEVLTPVETVHIKLTTSVSESVEALRSEVPI